MNNKVLKKLFSLGLLLGVGGYILTGCKGADNSTKGDSEVTNHLNIALQPSPSFLPVKLLSDNNWVQEALDEAGFGQIEVKYTEFESGPPENESFAAGQQDIGVIGNVPTISGIASGQKRTIIGISANGYHTQGVVVKKDSDIASIEDLKGKKVGLVVGSISQDFLDRLLQSVNLKTEDVELVNLSPGEQPQALENGDVDAITSWNPTLTKVQSDGIGTLLVDGEGLYLGENTIFVQDDYLATNREVIEIFLKQYARAVKEIQDNKEKYAKEYAQVYGLDEQVLLQVINDFEYPLVLSEDDIKDLQGTADFLYDNELIGKQVTVSDYSDTGFNDLLNENSK